MRIKYSALVSDVRGKLNGSKGSKSRSSHTLLNKVKPVNRNTAGQIGARADIRYYSHLWGQQTDPIRAAWDALALQVSKKNSFGDSYKTTGFNLFMAVNCKAKFFSQAGDVTTPPSLVAPTLGGNIAHPLPNFTTSVSFVLDIPAVATDDILVVYATPMVSAGRSFVKGQFRPILFQTAHASQAALDILSAYAAVFGNPVKGKKVYLYAQYYSTVGKGTNKYYAGAEVSAITT
jgi:hypothetical protein